MTPTPPDRTFLGAPVCPDLEGVSADFAVLGIPYGVPYDMRGVHPDAANAPAAFRARTQRLARFVDHYDFDLGGTLFGDTGTALVDCGDLPGDPSDLAGNKARATAAVGALLERGVTPLVLGGDDSIPPLVVRAFAAHGPVNVLQIDAHLDFRDSVNGVADGYSSTMRRIREMPWVGRIVQVGLRGPGSARPVDVEEALAAGNVLVTADEVHDRGTDAVLRHLVDDAPWFVTFDVDGLDPTIAPGTSAPLPGGLDYREVTGIFRALSRQCTFAGIDIVEHFPSLDVRDMTSMTLGRLLCNLIGSVARSRADAATATVDEQS